MNDSDPSPGQVSEITAYVDIETQPPPAPAALVIFGTNQRQPADIAASRYHSGLAPLIIVTGGINRHSGVVEGQMFRQLLHAAGVPDSSIRVEDQSANTCRAYDRKDRGGGTHRPAGHRAVRANPGGRCIRACARHRPTRRLRRRRLLCPAAIGG